MRPDIWKLVGLVILGLIIYTVHLSNKIKALEQKKEIKPLLK
jgi:hypothetical protein